MNFLVVDDNRLYNRFLTTYLRSNGHAASSLHDPTKVEVWLSVNHCDGLILDIGMPQLNGFTLLKKLRQTYDRRRLVVVICTGWTKDAELLNLIAASDANGYVFKATGPAEIYTAVMEAFERRDAALKTKA